MPSFPARIRAATRALFGRSGYDAAGMSGRWPGAASLPSPISQGLAARTTIGDRAAYLAENSPHVASTVRAIATNMVGDGPSIRHPHKQLVVAWQAFETRCDAEGVQDLAGVCELVARTWAIYGEAFVLLRTDPETTELRLQVIPPSQVDATRSEDLGGGAQIIAGVEIDAQCRRRRYWITPTPPDGPHPMTAESEPIPAEDVCHIFERRFAAQVRGITPLGSILTRAKEVDELEDAGLAKAKVTALFAGFIRDLDGTSGLGGHTGREREELSLEPGALRMLPSGADVVFTPTQETSGATDLIRHMVRSIAAGAGLPYELVSHDLSQVNYSSARLGVMEFRRRVVFLQRVLLVGQFLRPAFRRFAAIETLAGRLSLDLDAMEDPAFIFPGWAPIDPQKETAADVTAINARLKSRTEVIAARGRDPEEVDAEIARDPTPAQPEAAANA